MPGRPLTAPIPGSAHQELGGVKLDIVKAGAARVKRMIYPAGFRWSRDLKPLLGVDQCMHAHVGFLAHGSIHIHYPDGCVSEYEAPAVVAIDPGHDPTAKLGMPTEHKH